MATKLLISLPADALEKMTALDESVLRSLGVISVIAYADLPENERTAWRETVTGIKNDDAPETDNS